MFVLTWRHDALDVSGVEQALCELDGVSSGGEPVLVVVHEGRDEHGSLEDIPVGPVLLTPQHIHLQRYNIWLKFVLVQKRENKLVLKLLLGTSAFQQQKITFDKVSGTGN